MGAGPVLPNSSGEVALQAAADFVKYTVTIGAGALAFSVDLVTRNLIFGPWTERVLMFSWLVLAVSVATGVMAWSRIPIQLATQNYNLEDNYFTVPGKIHQICFVLGILAIGLAIFMYVLTRAPSDFVGPRGKKTVECGSASNLGSSTRSSSFSPTFSPVFSPTFSPVLPNCCSRCSSPVQYPSPHHSRTVPKPSNQRCK